ncbi:DUF3455 domain-containing protein [Labrys wisconsinensis]|uniref:DUF3455 domain-containing protein n=1 Tax=Labrys wisconsinensis TaxID=425677 RepID=A0ABU0JJW0_9HYPH|nr:DUF3455 domain-containing protein [Labrys wisconsinensis]MDQ0474567.1 hypothetical protein [Labrys wisconsinensis]
MSLPCLLLAGPVLLAGALSAGPAAAATLPEAIAAPGEVPVLTLHAEGAQIYQCKADAAGKPAWTFREPIATLIADGKTVGRHYAGPSWALDEGSAVTGKVAGSAPGATAQDIPWLKLAVAAHHGSGALADVVTVQRIDTSGGKLDGACDQPGIYRSVPYSATYVFLRKG